MSKAQILQEFGIKHNRYDDYHVAPVGKITCRIFSNLAQESILSYPEFIVRLILAWLDLGGSFHSLLPPTIHPSNLQMPFFIPHPISLCSELFKLPPCYS